MTKPETGFQTLCAREIAFPRTTEPHILPLYLTSAFDFEDVDQGLRIFMGVEKGHVYGRYGNPTVEAVEDKLVALETYQLEIESKALLYSSGMAAIHGLFSTLLRPGDALLTQANLYGGTTELLLKFFKPYNVEIVFTDLSSLEDVRRSFEEHANIKLVFGETPANPTHSCFDIEAIAMVAHDNNARLAIDNTFATPFLQRPFSLGADFIVHSTTKYLNGHGTGMGGAVLGRDVEWVRERLWEMRKLSGASISPFEAWLVHNGLKTLPLRMRALSQNALAIANFLSKHPSVEYVNYCGLPDHAYNAIASKQMRHYGGIVSFELKGGMEAGIDFMRKSKFSLAPTLGDVDTLVLHPASMSHIRVDRELRLKNGITDGLVRLSVGIEDIDDLLGDLERSLE